MDDNGASCGPGSTRSAPEAPAGLRPPGDDPSRELRMTWAVAMICFREDRYQLGLYVNNARTENEARGTALKAFMAECPGYSVANVIVREAGLSDTDEGPEGLDRNGLGGEAATAGAEGITQPDPNHVTR